MSGVPYKGEKRPATETIDQNATGFAEEDTLDLESLKKTGNVATCEPQAPADEGTGQFELAFTANGELWAHALTDGIISANWPLCFVYGRFHTGNEAEAHRKKKVPLMPYQITSAGAVAHWQGAASWDKKFSTEPKEFLCKLLGGDPFERKYPRVGL